jgi:triacylglycerol lipase
MFPIVLVHGIARFDFIAELFRRIPGVELDHFQYFNGIADHLSGHGFGPVFAPHLEFAASSDDRAATLKEKVEGYLREAGAEKVHIIAHSMGGLDARRMISKLGMAERVASLTTIGTPHLGTVLADHVINDRGGDDLIRGLRVFLNLEGANDLTVEACAKFDRETVQDEATNGVFYQTYAGHEAKDRVFGPLLLSHKYISGHLPDGTEAPEDQPVLNDGLVPFESQQWTSARVAADGSRKEVAQHVFPFPADHLNETGWWDWEEREGLFELASPIRQKREYENKVKAVYLGIAQSVQQFL